MNGRGTLTKERQKFYEEDNTNARPKYEDV